MRFPCSSDRRDRRSVAVAAVLAAGLAASLAGGGLTAAAQTAATDPLAERGYTVTGGAAPGYVDDQLCGSCHADLYRSYQEVAMAKSFYRPSPEGDVED